MSNSIKDDAEFVKLFNRFISQDRDIHLYQDITLRNYGAWDALVNNEFKKIIFKAQQTLDNIYKYIDKHVEIEIEKAKLESNGLNNMLDDLGVDEITIRRPDKKESAIIESTNTCYSKPLEYRLKIKNLDSVDYKFIMTQILDEMNGMANLTVTSWLWGGKLSSVTETYWKKSSGTAAFLFTFTACDGKLEQVTHAVESCGDEIHLNIKEIAKSLVCKVKSVNAAKYASK